MAEYIEDELGALTAEREAIEAQLEEAKELAKELNSTKNDLQSSEETDQIDEQIAVYQQSIKDLKLARKEAIKGLNVEQVGDVNDQLKAARAEAKELKARAAAIQGELADLMTKLVSEHRAFRRRISQEETEEA